MLSRGGRHERAPCVARRGVSLWPDAVRFVGKGPDTATTLVMRTTLLSGAGILTCKGHVSKRSVVRSASGFVPVVYARAESGRLPSARGYGCQIPRRVLFTRSTESTPRNPSTRCIISRRWCTSRMSTVKSRYAFLSCVVVTVARLILPLHAAMAELTLARSP